MSNGKPIILLLFLILLTVAANVVLTVGSRGSDTARRLFLSDFDDDVRDIRIVRRGGVATEISCQSGVWRIVSPFSGSAEPSVVMKLVDALAQTPVVDVISDADLLRLDRTRADFSLNEPVLKVTLTTDSGETTTYSFGVTTPSDNGIYAAIGGIAAVFVVPSSVLTAVDMSVDDFRRRSVVSVMPDEVSSLSVRREGGKALEFVRGKTGWTIGNQKAAEDKVSKFLTELSSANAIDFVWPVSGSNETNRASASLLAGYGLDPDAAVSVTVNGFDGMGRRIVFGKAVGEGLVYALIQDGSAVVTVPAGLKDFAMQSEAVLADTRLFPVDARSVSVVSLVVDGGIYSMSLRNGLWSLESPVVAPADQKSSEALLSRVLNLSSADVVGANGVAVSISTNAAKTFVSRESVLGGLSLESLRSREMLRIDPALVRRIVSQSGEEGAKPSSVVYDRDRRTWNVESGADGYAVSAKGVDAVLSAINPLVASRVVKLNVSAGDMESFGLDTPFLTVAVDQSADTAVRRNILVGKKTGGGRFATIGSSDAVFVIPESVITKLASPLFDK